MQSCRTIHVEYLEMAVDEHFHGLRKIFVRTTNATILHGSFEFFYRYDAILKKNKRTNERIVLSTGSFIKKSLSRSFFLRRVINIRTSHKQRYDHAGHNAVRHVATDSNE